MGEQEVPNMRSEPAVSVAALLAGVVAGRPFGAVHSGTCRRSGLVEDLRPLRTAGRPGKVGVPPIDDGTVAAVRLLHGNDELAPDGASQLRRRGLSLPLRQPASGPRYDRQFPPAASSGSGVSLIIRPGPL